MTMRVPLLDLEAEYRYMKEAIDAALARCLAHQHWILGPEVEALEKRIAEYSGSPHAIGVASGTDALLLPLRALALARKGQEYFSRNDLVLTTPFTFTATGDAILRAGATPLFADIDPETFNLDPGLVAEAFESRLGERIVGIIPVHLYGQSCRMSEIGAIARARGAFVLEDVAQAFGGAWEGRKLGSLGTVGAYSFFPSKNLGGFGDGGMVVTADAELARLVQMLRKHGGADKYNVDHIGYNSRLDALQAAILCAKFEYLEEFNERRRATARRYDEALADARGLVAPRCADPDRVRHVYHQYTLRMEGGRRDDVQKKLKAEGIATAVYYPVPLNTMKVFRARCEIHGSLAGAERAAQEVLSLPMGPMMGEEAVAHVCAVLRRIFV